MDPIEPSLATTVSEAIVIWAGWKSTPWPAYDEQGLVDRYGPDSARDLMPIVRELEDEFFESDAHVTNRAELGKAAADRFRRLHPEISDDAIDALAWCYDYNYK